MKDVVVHGGMGSISSIKTPQHIDIIDKKKSLDFYVYMLYSLYKDTNHVGASTVAHKKTLGI